MIDELEEILIQFIIISIFSFIMFVAMFAIKDEAWRYLKK